MKITIIGTGFVGLVTAGVLAKYNHHVIGLDINVSKINSLNQGIVPFFEPSLPELIHEQLGTGRLSFTTSYEEAIPEADLIIIAVGTPSNPDNSANLDFIYQAIDKLLPLAKNDAVIAVKSTTPPLAYKTIKEKIAAQNKACPLAFVPEFLREGNAVNDTLHPTRIIIGTDNEQAFSLLADLHEPFQVPIIKTNFASAMLIKYTSNCYLANRINFINQISDLCDVYEGDINQIIKGISLDPRIGAHYWYPGLGYGGSCYPKDIKELAYMATQAQELDNLVIHLNRMNEARIPKILTKIEKKIGGFNNKTVAVLGLAHKPNSDDTRDAPALKVIPFLFNKGAKITSYDPQAKLAYPEFKEKYNQYNTIEEATSEANLIIVLIEWTELITYDYNSSRNPNIEQWIFDVRNQLTQKEIEASGFKYLAIGKGLI